MGPGTARLRSILLRLWRIETSRSDRTDARDRGLRRIAEIAIIAILVVSALVVGGRTYRAHVAMAAFYQPFFGPALNLVCNGTFNDVQDTPPVKDFLELKSRALGSCEGVHDFPARKMDWLQVSMSYLEIMAAGTWKVFGITWENLYVVAALLSAGLALSSYLLFRVFCESRLAAAIGTYLFITSAYVIDQIPHLRDFSKAPFLVAALACLAASTISARRPITVFLFAAAAGSLVAIGLGFRSDLNVVLPIALAAPVLFIGRGRWRFALALAVAAWAGFACGYIALNLPRALIVSSSEQGTMIPHAFILGFAEQFLRDQLGMADVSYSVFRPYHDWSVDGVSTLFAGTPTTEQLVWPSERYAEVSTKLLRAIFLLTPQDVFFRTFYTFNAIGHQPLLSRIWGAPLMLLTLLFLFSRLREYLFILLSFLVLASVLSLQFDVRHAFYMSVFAPAIVLLAMSSGWSTILAVARSGLRLPAHAAPVGIGFCASALLVVGTGAAVPYFLGGVQRDALARLAHTVSGLEWQSIAYRANRDDIEPLFANAHDGSTNSFVPKHGDGDAAVPTTHGVYSRLTFKVQPVDLKNKLPLQLTWTALQERTSFKNEPFQFSTRRPGYAIESSSIAGTDLMSRLAEKNLPRRILIQIKGETLGGVVAVGVLNNAKTAFAFSDRLPDGAWDYAKIFEITPDLSSFSIMFSNLRDRTTFRVDAVDLLVPPTGECGLPGAAITSKYRYQGSATNLGGFLLKERAGIATYYFPLTFTKVLSFTGLDLGGLSPDCVLDWSVAKSFPAGTVPAEYLLMDGKFDNSPRGDWGTIWRHFN